VLRSSSAIFVTTPSVRLQVVYELMQFDIVGIGNVYDVKLHQVRFCTAFTKSWSKNSKLRQATKEAICFNDV